MEKLKLDFEIPDFLEEDIESMVKSVNNKESIMDCWQDTIRADLNCCDGTLTDEQIKEVTGLSQSQIDTLRKNENTQ